MEKYQKVVATGLLIHNEHALIIRRGLHEKFLPGKYELPGGKVDFGEDPSISLSREFSEEVNIKIEVTIPFRTFSYVMEDENRHSIEIMYLVKLLGDPRDIKLSEDHDDFKWITIDD